LTSLTFQTQRTELHRYTSTHPQKKPTTGCSGAPSSELLLNRIKSHVTRF